MDWFWNEFRWIARRLSGAPMFTGITLLTLAVGIGANTAIFSVVNGVLLKPLPYSEAERLLAVGLTAPGVGITDLPLSPSTYFALREEGQSFENFGLWKETAVNITGLAEPERVEAMSVTQGILPTLRVQPQLGRAFSADDDQPGRPKTAILTHAYWQRRFGADRTVVGRSIRVDGEAREVIRVLPADFRFMNIQSSLLLPFQFNRKDAMVGNFSFPSIARLKSGVTLEQASADLARILKMLPDKFRLAPGMNRNIIEEARMGPRIQPLKDEVIGDIGKVLWVLMATIGIVLFIACANVANLMLVRVEGRQREIAVRAALGASRLQIARELLLESAVLGLAGGVLGLGVAAGAIALLQALAPPSLPRLEEIDLDAPVLAFTAGLSVLAGVLFGLIPVLKCAGPSLEQGIHGGGRTMSEGRERHRARGVLVVVQVALALVLLIGAGLMIRTMQALQRVEPGFTQPTELMTLRISIPNVRLQEEITRRLQSIPGVQSVGMANSVPTDGNNNNDALWAETKAYRDGEIPPVRRYKYVGPAYFSTMGNPLKAGRDVTWQDIHSDRPVVMVSESLAIELWGSAQAALGKRVRENPKENWQEVIGVAGNERDNGADHAAPAIVYFPMGARPSLAFVLRTPRAGTEALLTEIRQQIAAVNPDLPIASPRTMQALYARSMARTSFTLTILSIAAGMALLLGVIGIYGVISYAVTQRTREISIRLALGAQQGSVRAMFLRYALTLAAVGVVCGLAAAMPLRTYAAVAATLVGAAALAAYLPARRASNVEPMSALRAE